MKSILLILLCTSLSLPLASSAAAAAATSAQTEYADAVKSYVDAAEVHVRALRGEIDAQLKDASDDTKKRFNKVYAELDKCDKLVGDLKTTGPKNFDRVKAEFEATRGRLLKELEAARKE
jgi:Skp family chaperone for outer membrane proteins